MESSGRLTQRLGSTSVVIPSIIFHKRLLVDLPPINCDYPKAKYNLACWVLLNIPERLFLPGVSYFYLWISHSEFFCSIFASMWVIPKGTKINSNIQVCWCCLCHSNVESTLISFYCYFNSTRKRQTDNTQGIIIQDTILPCPQKEQNNIWPKNIFW